MGGGGNVYITLLCQYRNTFLFCFVVFVCITMGSDESHSNNSLIAGRECKGGKVTRPQTTTFEQKGEPKRGIGLTSPV